MQVKAPEPLAYLPEAYKGRGLTAAIESRRKYLSVMVEADQESVSAEEAKDLKRVNDELDSLLKYTKDNPHPGGMGLDADGRMIPFPGGKGTGRTTGPSVLKSGYWSESFIKAGYGSGRGTKALVSGTITVPSLLPGIVMIPDRPIYLSQVIPSKPLDGTNQFEYLQETVRTHAAAEVASAGLKPTSTYTVAAVTDQARTIATLSQPIDRYALEDTDALQQYLEGSLAKAVVLRLDSQLLNGNGTAPNLRGMLNVVGIQNQAFSSSILQTARKAKTLLYGAEIYDPAAMVYVMSPAQWEAVELLQLSTGAYIMQGGSTNEQGAPVDLAAQRLWGSPVIVTDALSGNNALLFVPGYTQIWERDAVQVDWSTAPQGSQSGHTAFESNELIFRAEGRYGFGSLKPNSIVTWATS